MLSGRNRASTASHVLRSPARSRRSPTGFPASRTTVRTLPSTVRSWVRSSSSRSTISGDTTQMLLSGRDGIHLGGKLPAQERRAQLASSDVPDPLDRVRPVPLAPWRHGRDRGDRPPPVPELELELAE